MRRTSEISVTDITHLAKFRGYVNQNYFKNDSTLVVEKNFTEHLLCTKTRYADTFWFYQTDAIIGQSLYHYGEYTENELGLLRNFMQPTSVIYDIGANIGVHSIAFCKGTKHVYAFEPNHNNLKLLKINLSRENNKTILPYAISDSCGTTHIEQFTLGSLGNYGECKITTEGQECEKYTIDYLVDNKKILPPSIVKIDVEGHENNVFDGMQKTIKEHLPVIFFEAMYCDNAKIYDQLNGFGYDIYWFPCPNYNPNNFRKNSENIFGSGGVINILAAPFYLELKTNLPKMIDRDDTWLKVLERLNAKRD